MKVKMPDDKTLLRAYSHAARWWNRQKGVKWEEGLMPPQTMKCYQMSIRKLFKLMKIKVTQ